MRLEYLIVVGIVLDVVIGADANLGPGDWVLEAGAAVYDHEIAFLGVVGCTSNDAVAAVIDWHQVGDHLVVAYHIVHKANAARHQNGSTRCKSVDPSCKRFSHRAPNDRRPEENNWNAALLL